ncbi:MAG: Kynurenine 3-monooxygenase [Chlamydiae bacterium]|nr:Kynurenine 3-monooxygenase [Chlamydiota bacterium]
MSEPKKIVIIGGGPAGSTAAILLAKAGFEVSLYEKDCHPRYHIGESGILSLPWILQQLDLEERVISLGCKRKGGVLFDWNERWLINWGESGQYTYHVIRSEFDHLLLTRARECGVRVYEETKVESIEFNGDCVESVSVLHKGDVKRVVCDYLIDASGRAAILARRYLDSQKPLNAFQNVALWGYWLKAKPSHTLKDFHGIQGYTKDLENPIVLSSIPNGWIWGIPLHDKTFSVGVVLSQKFYNEEKKKKDKKVLYKESLEQSQIFMSLLEKAYLVSSVQQTQDWSYRTTKWAGDNYFLAGDAAVFIDPLLSTGMTSAMLSSVTAAACIKALEKKEIAREKIIHFYGDDYQKRFWRLSFVIGALYGAKGHVEDLFHQTHSLTSDDLQGSAYEEIKQSFSSVISGLEDLKELSASDLQKIAADRLRENFKEYAQIIPKLPDSKPHSLELCFETIALKERST